MRTKSINILFFVSVALLLTSCVQELVEKNYKPTVAGYKQDDSTVFAVDNRKPIGVAASRATSNVPILYTDPYATGRSIGQQQAAPPVSYGGLQPSGYGSNAYGSLGAAPSGVFGQGVLIQSTTPVYQQPAYGDNIYAPQRR